LQTPSWTKGDLNTIHELDLTTDHKNKTKDDELSTIKGLLGMLSIITSLKSELALPRANQYSMQTTLHFVHSKFSEELQRRYRSFQMNWKKLLERHCKAYLYVCSHSNVYTETFQVRVGTTTFSIKSGEHEIEKAIEQLKGCIKRFVHLKHFLETCVSLFRKAK